MAAGESSATSSEAGLTAIRAAAAGRAPSGWTGGGGTGGPDATARRAGGCLLAALKRATGAPAAVSANKGGPDEGAEAFGRGPRQGEGPRKPRPPRPAPLALVAAVAPAALKPPAGSPQDEHRAAGADGDDDERPDATARRPDDADRGPLALSPTTLPTAPRRQCVRQPPSPRGCARKSPSVARLVSLC